MELKRYLVGTKCDVWLCPDAKESWDEANRSVREKARAQLPARLSLLGDNGQLRSPDHMNAEGEGIFAAKANAGLRAYGWFTNIQGKKAFVISHVIYKDQPKLDPADRDQAVNIRSKYEEEEKRK